MFHFSQHTHRTVFLGGLYILVAALPLSVFMISVAEITLTLNWLLESDFTRKWTLIRQKKSVWILSLFYLVHLAGMLYTNDFNWGFHDLKIKLPMLVLPLVIGTSTPVRKKDIRNILTLFILALIVNSAITISHFLKMHHDPVYSMTQASILLSYIRLSLMINLALFSGFWIIRNAPPSSRWFYIPAMIWLIIYLYLLHSLTGIVVFIIVSLILLTRLAILSRNLMFRWFMIVSALTVLLVTASYLSGVYTQLFTFDNVDPATMDKTTLHGHPYRNDFHKKDVENGHYTYLYICEPELREAWNKRSKLPYDSLNRIGGMVKYPLIRYLTSKGLRKDEEGVNKLSPGDIRNIEWGMTNYLFDDNYGIYPRIYTAFWELYQFHMGHNPSGFSISQRIVAMKTALHIIRKNLWLGVGTGDICQAFRNQYIEDRTPLKPADRIRAHDQWVTFIATFGITGFTVIAISLFIPVFLEKKWTSYLFLLIFLIGFLSFLNEDTLETQAGISFFAFFYALFLFAKDDTG